MIIKILSLVRNECNYGQRLQEYALQTFLKKNFPLYNISVCDTRTFLDKRQNSNLIKLSLFLKFESDFINFSFIDKECDYYVVGSDQVFNWKDLSTKSERDFFTFQWLKDKHKIITYSTSFDPNRCNYNDYCVYFNTLKELNYISLREKTNIDYLSSNHINVPMGFHIDPVLLLNKDEWIKIAKKPIFDIPVEYDFLYTTYKKYDNYDKNTTVCCSCKDFYDERSRYIGPSEFIWLINNARTIKTNSFHCFLLCKVFEKNMENVLNFNKSDFRYNNYIDYDYGNNVNQINRSLNYFKDKLRY